MGDETSHHLLSIYCEPGAMPNTLPSRHFDLWLWFNKLAYDGLLKHWTKYLLELLLKKKKQRIIAENLSVF